LRDRHCERSEAIHEVGGRRRDAGLLRRCAPRNDDFRFISHLHDFVGVATFAHEVGDASHRLVDVLKEGLVAFAKVVQPLFACRRLEEGLRSASIGAA
jgi:hypothetical protein